MAVYLSSLSRGVSPPLFVQRNSRQPHVGPPCSSGKHCGSQGEGAGLVVVVLAMCLCWTLWCCCLCWTWQGHKGCQAVRRSRVTFHLGGRGSCYGRQDGDTISILAPCVLCCAESLLTAVHALTLSSSADPKCRPGSGSSPQGAASTVGVPAGCRSSTRVGACTRLRILKATPTTPSFANPCL